jgi:hypothetical protein
MATILKRIIPATTATTAVLRRQTFAAVGTRLYSEGATARDPGWQYVSREKYIIRLLTNNCTIYLQKEGKGS